MGPAVLPASRRGAGFSPAVENVESNWNTVVSVAYYHGRLPHWTPEGKDLFLTWRLHGSLPAHRYVPPHGLSSGRAFVCLDRYLDRATQGPTWLRRPDVADLCVRALHYGDEVLNHYRLQAWVVMPNHVHLLISPLTELAKILHSIKGFTARRANQILGRVGLPFWQKEFFDHWIRNERGRERVRAYIEGNPVTAGLASTPNDYRWSSAAMKTRQEAGENAGSPAGLPARPCTTKERKVNQSYVSSRRNRRI